MGEGHQVFPHISLSLDILYPKGTGRNQTFFIATCPCPSGALYIFNKL